MPISPAWHNPHRDNLLLKCNCWHPPLPHFLVCHTYSLLALETFFTQNRFVITPDTDLYTTAAPCRPFLRNVPPPALHWLKDLEIIFPAYEAKKHTRVSKLAIWDLTSVLKNPDVCIDKVILHTRGLPKKECLKLWRRYREMVLAFKELDGLGRLEVNLYKPWYHSYHAGCDMRRVKGLEDVVDRGLMERKVEMEGRLEREVMGREYEGDAEGRYEMPQGGWWGTRWGRPHLPSGLRRGDTRCPGRWDPFCCAESRQE
ncbi:hypothetical protein KVT40_007025 [Elsinoe batatas]|uniref:Uncharacterized protein n=1 Tax=Elsinoe batatas TaxID=2601811 RepID=A0A8K0PH68_9PEZI|nr:hypothetical protein KVT40_007025 [Elsinoe batatas]